MHKAMISLAIVLSFSLGACGGGDDDESSEDQVAVIKPIDMGCPGSYSTVDMDCPGPSDVDNVLPEYTIQHVCDDTDFTSDGSINSAGPNYHCSPDDVIRHVNAHTCSDEYGQAIAASTMPGWEISVPALWDAVPFIVDVSSRFENAHELLGMIHAESERIQLILGYEIFVAGNVLSLEDLARAEITSITVVESRQLIPPDQHIEIRCCVDAGSEIAGTSNAHIRMVLLNDNEHSSRHIVIHELYHLLGFTHPGSVNGVWMSEILMKGSRFLVEYDFTRSYNPLYSPTQPSAFDLEKLACIFDERG